MSRDNQSVYKLHNLHRRVYFCWICFAFSLFIWGIFVGNIVHADPREGRSINAKPAKGKATASITSDHKNLIFTRPDGTIIRSIALLNEKIEYSKTPSENVTYLRYDRVVISNDRSHAAIFTQRYEYEEKEKIKNNSTMTFRYYDSSGKLWEKKSDNFTFYENALSSDGSRILLYGSDIIGVYNEKGQLLYPLSLGFVDINNLVISPNGKYVYSEGLLDYEKGPESIKVIDIDKKKSFDFPYDNDKGEIENLQLTADGRFEFEYLGRKNVLPK
ncbi:MAG: hypothetical protein ACHQYP_09280 [Nitrospiria bacterium]